MFSLIVIALFTGLLVGVFTGLVPGVHINLVTLILISSLSGFSGVPGLVFVVFIVSLAITHTFLDFIPGVFLGAPDEGTFLSVLPGHQMLKEGRAFEAVVLTLFGSVSALFVILLFTPIFLFLVPRVFDFSRLVLPFLLVFVSLFLVLREKRVVLSLLVFVLAGFLGFACLNLPVREPLLPLLTGLFASSALIVSLGDRVVIPKQEFFSVRNIRLPKKEFLFAILGSVVSAPLCSFLPGVGAGHAAVIGSEFFKQSRRGFLVLLGGINTIVMGLSFITLFAVGRSRTGAAVAVAKILPDLSLSDLFIILLVIFVSGVLAFFLAIKVSRVFSFFVGRVDYQKLSVIILLLLFFITVFLSNFLGVLVFITGSALGVFCILSGVRRINLMGCLLVPTILFYLFF